MTMIALRHLAEVNPSSPEFDALPADADVLFLPLETVWSDDRADQSRRVPKSTVDSGYTRFQAGDTVCPKVTPTFQAGRAMRARSVGAGTTELHILRPRPGVDPRWVTYAVRSKHFLEEGVTAFQGVAGLQRVPQEFVANFRVADAPLEEQRRIADFLDDRVARIDQIIAARRRQSEALASVYPARLGSEDFGSGSGTRLRYICSPVDMRGGDDLPLLSVSIHHGVTRRDEVSDRPGRAEDLSKYKRVQPSDIVLNRMRAFQGAVGIARESGVVSPDYLVLRPAEVDPEWLECVLRSPWFVGQMIERLRGIGSIDLGTVRTPRINWADLADIQVAVPPHVAQLQLAEEVRSLQARLSTARRSVARMADLFEEFKRSLITAAVTGEIDVTTAGSGIQG
ncbi:hypothetical protein [Knoellia koreensis]|uniref:Type I restriction modification DNA specificity domain-containing protein n=1 Tax=Knoellia koreensis TaxID=2730921 RepID=A0A849HCW2_9MICO|nr:hypothetical protein [Knoellia sp. DB2414S]NNM47740.1 hypothetical protein [Knoellia sp. DB2414S]